MLTVTIPVQRILMCSGNCNVKVLSLNICAPVLNHPNADALNIQNRSKREHALICRHRQVCRYRNAAGCNSGSSSADMRIFLRAIRRAEKFSRILSSHPLRQNFFLETFYRFFVLHCTFRPILESALVNIPVLFELLNPCIFGGSVKNRQSKGNAAQSH